MSITTVAQYQNSANGAVVTSIMKASVSNNQQNGTFTSLWTVVGNPPAGSIPGASTTCTSATTGAVPFTNPPGGVTTYVTAFELNGGGNQYPGSMIAYDRLQHMAGLSGISVLSQTVNLAVPPARNALADLSNIEWYVECYVDLGAASQTLTVNYTNTANVAGSVAVTIPATYRVGNMLRVVPTVSGDIIKTIDTCSFGGSTGAAGNFGFTCLRRLASTMAAWGYKSLNSTAFQTGLGMVPNDACVAFAILMTGGTVTTCGSIGLGVG